MEIKRINHLKSKKGISLGDMYPAILTLVLVGLLLGIGIYIMIGVRRGIQTNLDGFDNVNISSGSTTLNGSLTSLYLDPSTVSVTWDDNTSAITNYSLSPEAGIITWGADVIDVDRVNITYVYMYDQKNADIGLTTAITGVDDFADWFAIIVVVLAAAIVLGVIFRSFGKSTAI